MSNSWQRPDGADPTPAPAESSIDVPLTGDGPLSPPVQAAGSTPPTNWRRLIGFASLSGVALGILVPVVLIGVVWNDDESDDEITADPSNTLDEFDLATTITTPPTLASLEPEPGPMATPSPAGSPLPTRDGSLLDEITVPAYPLSRIDVPTAPGTFDLAIAVEQLATDAARRSSTTLELGVGGYRRSYSVLRDPDGDRYGATLDRVVVVVDGQAGATYLEVSSSDDERWVRTDNARVAASFDVDSVTVLFQRLLHGPVRADTIDMASVTPGDMVVLDDERTMARAFTVELPGDLVPEWQLYAFGPTDEFLPSDRPTRLEYTVYVDERNEIRRVVGLSDLGGIPQLIVHDIELLDEPIGVDLPAAALILDELDDATGSG